MTLLLRLRAAFSAGLLCCMSSVGLGLVAGCAPDPGDADEVEDRPELIERFGRVAQALATDVAVYANTSLATPMTRIERTGTHPGPDTASSGTDDDLHTHLLPSYLDTGSPAP